MDNNGKFLPDAGTVKDARCGVCDSEMGATRNLTGCTSWVGHMAHKHQGGASRNYDCFTCPYFEEEWHKKATELLRLAAETPSPTLAKIYKDDALHMITNGQGQK